MSVLQLSARERLTRSMVGRLRMNPHSVQEIRDVVVGFQISYGLPALRDALYRVGRNPEEAGPDETPKKDFYLK